MHGKKANQNRRRDQSSTEGDKWGEGVGENLACRTGGLAGGDEFFADTSREKRGKGFKAQEIYHPLYREGTCKKREGAPVRLEWSGGG